MFISFLNYLFRTREFVLARIKDPHCELAMTICCELYACWKKMLVIKKEINM